MKVHKPGEVTPVPPARAGRSNRVVGGFFRSVFPKNSSNLFRSAPLLAGPGPAKLESFERYCPHVDSLGINAYGDAGLVPHALDLAGVDRPFLLTEFGPTGHWEVRATPWGAPNRAFGPRKGRQLFGCPPRYPGPLPRYF